MLLTSFYMASRFSLQNHCPACLRSVGTLKHLFSSPWTVERICKSVTPLRFRFKWSDSVPVLFLLIFSLWRLPLNVSWDPNWACCCYSCPAPVEQEWQGWLCWVPARSHRGTSLAFALWFQIVRWVEVFIEHAKETLTAKGSGSCVCVTWEWSVSCLCEVAVGTFHWDKLQGAQRGFCPLWRPIPGT